MNTYNVSVPITGVLVVTVQASDEKEAENLALQADWTCEIINNSDFLIELDQIDTHRQICRGNMFGGCLNEIEAELYEEYNDDNEENEDNEDE